MLEARSVAMTAGMSAVSRGEFVIPARMYRELFVLVTEPPE